MNKNAEIPLYKDVFDLLQLPEWLNGKELNYSSSKCLRKTSFTDFQPIMRYEE